MHVSKGPLSAKPKISRHWNLQIQGVFGRLRYDPIDGQNIFELWSWMNELTRGPTTILLVLDDHKTHPKYAALAPWAFGVSNSSL